MTKGKLNPKYLKGFTNEEANVWKSKWVEPVKYEKVSSAARMYSNFEEDSGDIFEDVIDKTEDYWKFNQLKRVARNYAFQHNSALWTMKTANDYKMLVMSYSFRHSIPIPPDHKFGKDL